MKPLIIAADLYGRWEAFGCSFRFFVHAGSCDGENRKLYPIRMIKEEDIPALQRARKITLGELVRRFGDPASEKAFEEGDYQIYLLNTYLERMENETIYRDPALG